MPVSGGPAEPNLDHDFNSHQSGPHGFDGQEAFASTGRGVEPWCGMLAMQEAEDFDIRHDASLAEKQILRITDLYFQPLTHSQYPRLYFCPDLISVSDNFDNISNILGVAYCAGQ